MSPSRRFRGGSSFLFRFGEPFKKQGRQEFRVKPVLAASPGFFQLVSQVVLVSAVQKSWRLLLQEIDKHQPVEEHRRIPTSLPIVRNAFDEFQKYNMLFLKLSEELLRDLLNIQRTPEPMSDFDDTDVPFRIKVGEVEHHLAQFRQEQVSGLAIAEQVFPRECLSVLPLHPVPQTLSTIAVDKDQQVLVMSLDYLFVNCGSHFRVGDLPFYCLDFKHNSARQFGNLTAIEPRFLDCDLVHLPSRRVRPAQLLNEEPTEIELLQAFASVFKMDRHNDSWQRRCRYDVSQNVSVEIVPNRIMS